MADSKKWFTIWGGGIFHAGDKVNCLVYKEEYGKIVEQTLKMRIGSVQAGKCPLGHAPVIYEYEETNDKPSVISYVPIDNLSQPSKK